MSATLNHPWIETETGVISADASDLRIPPGEYPAIETCPKCGNTARFFVMPHRKNGETVYWTTNCHAPACWAVIIIYND